MAAGLVLRKTSKEAMEHFDIPVQQIGEFFGATTERMEFSVEGEK
jgi:hypothetical protein